LIAVAPTSSAPRNRNGKQRTSGADDGVGFCFLGFFRHDFRGRVGEGHDQRGLAHFLDHIAGQGFGSGEAEENVGTFQRFVQRADVGFDGVFFLIRVHLFLAPGVDHTFAVADNDVLFRQAGFDKEVEAGEGRRTGAVGDQFDVVPFAVLQVQPVGDGGGDDDGGAVLIVMENGDLHALAQFCFDFETFRGLDVFEVDTAEGRFQRSDDLNQFLRVFFVDLDIDGVDVGEFLEEDGFALHDGLGGEGADIAEAENGGAVGDDGDEVAARGVVQRLERIFFDFLTGIGDAGRVGQRQVTLGRHGLGRGDRDLSRVRQTVIFKGRVAEGVFHGDWLWHRGWEQLLQNSL